MAMNQLGIGVVLEAKDLFSGVMQRAGRSFIDFEGKTSAAGMAVERNMGRLVTGLGMMGAGMAGLAALSVPLEAAKKYAQGISEITTLTDEASLGFDSVYNAVLDLNATFGGGSEKQIKAYYDGVSAGAANASQAMKLMTASNKLAIAGKTDASTALDGLTSSLNAYGLAFDSTTEGGRKNANRFSDALFTAVKQGKTTVPELAHVIGRVAPTASALGISFEELTASLAAVTTKGLKTEEAATGIKAALAGIIQPTSHATAEASRLGIKFTAAELRSKGWSKFLEQITQNAKFNADSIGKLFTSMEGFNAIQALSANGSAKFNESLAAMKDNTGATNKAFNTMSNTLAFQQQRFQGLKENAMVLIGDVLEPGAKSAVSFANALVQGFLNLPAPIRHVLVKGAAFVATLLTVVGAVSAGVAAFGMLKAGLAAAGVSIGGVVMALAPVLAGLAVVTAAVQIFRFALDRDLGGIGTYFSGIYAKVSLAIEALGQLFTDGGVSGPVKDDLLKAENEGVLNFVKRVFLAVERLKEFGESFTTGWRVAMHEASPAFEQFTASIDGLFNAFYGLWKAVDPEGAKATFAEYSSSGQKMGQIFAKASIAIVRGATAIVEGLTWIVEKAKELAPLGSAAMSIVDALGGVKGMVTLLEYAIVAMTAKAVVGAAIGLGGLASGAITATVQLGRMIAQFVILNGFDISKMATSLVASFRTMSAGIAASTGPLIAATAAITALYAAYDQWQKLQKELGDSGWKDMKNKLLRDVGYYSERDYERSMGIVVGDDYDNKKRNEAIYAKRAAVAAPPGSSGSTPAAAQTAATAPPSPLDFYKLPEQPAPVVNSQVQVQVSIDGEDLNAKVSSSAKRTGDRTFSPGVPVSG